MITIIINVMVFGRRIIILKKDRWKTRVSSHAKRVKNYIKRDKKDVSLTREKVKISENKPCCIKKQAI